MARPSASLPRRPIQRGLALSSAPRGHAPLAGLVVVGLRRIPRRDGPGAGGLLRRGLQRQQIEELVERRRGEALAVEAQAGNRAAPLFGENARYVPLELLDQQGNAADQAGETMSGYIRRATLSVARKELAK